MAQSHPDATEEARGVPPQHTAHTESAGSNERVGPDDALIDWPVAFWRLVRYKTRMCYNLERTGSCPYGDACAYAHCESELHTPDTATAEPTMVSQSVPMTKVERFARNVCRYTAASCPFGPRCKYTRHTVPASAGTRPIRPAFARVSLNVNPLADYRSPAVVAARGRKALVKLWRGANLHSTQDHPSCRGWNEGTVEFYAAPSKNPYRSALS